MSMTPEEAIKALRLERGIEINGNAVRVAEFLQGLGVAISAIRPVSREQVEKIKKEPIKGENDEWYCPSYTCPECGYENAGKGNFCHNCGCPFTDDAVEILMKRLEALHETDL